MASKGDFDDPDPDPDPIEACRRVWKYVTDANNAVTITAIATLFTAIATSAICVAGIESANAAKSAANTAASQLELAERPWLMTKADVGGPITFSGGEMRAPFLFTTKNVGNSPAMRVESGEEIFLGSPLTASPASEMSRYCENGDSLSPVKETIFPNQPLEGRVELSVSGKDIEKAHSEIEAANGLKLKENPLNAFLITCVVYHPAFISDKMYVTGVLYTIERKSPGNPDMPVLIRSGEDVAASDIILVPYGLGSTIAN